LTLRLPAKEAYEPVEQMVARLRLSTVCQSAHCPNIGECFSRGTATFMILGRRCTRSCRFCVVEKGDPERVDPTESDRVAEAVFDLGLSHAVITSVTRDDLGDGGADQFVKTIAGIRRTCSGTAVEVLVPDFTGSRSAIGSVCHAGPDVFNHNIETVPRLYPGVRPQARFQRSLAVLSMAASHGIPVKSGLMLGLGESTEEINFTLGELRRAGCDYLTIGQYLAPSSNHVPVARYVPPEEFEKWAEISRSLGFKGVSAGPLVRSSYRADEMLT